MIVYAAVMVTSFFAGGLGLFVGSVSLSMGVVLALVAGAAVYFGSGVLPEAFTFALDSNSGPLVVHVLPFIGLLDVGKLFGMIFERAITSVTFIYFTLFCTQITYQDCIAEDL